MKIPMDPSPEDEIPCPHPQCATERLIEYALEIISEGINIFANSEGWKMSPLVHGHLHEFAEYVRDHIAEPEDVVESDGSTLIVGDLHFPDIGGLHEASDD